MSESYIPTREAEALQWMQTFAANILADPGRYALAPADAINIKGLVDNFADKLAIATNHNTRTPAAIIEKDEARNAAEQLCRQYAILIKYNAGISNADKDAVGVRPVNPNREPIPAPDTSPVLNVVGATPGSQTVRFADSNTPETGRKPFGCTQLQLFVAIADTEVDQPDEAKFLGAFTRNPIGVAFDAADDGKIATYFARWASAKGAVGPWSWPVSMRIAA